MSEVQPFPATESSAGEVPDAPMSVATNGLFTPEVLRTILLCVAGWMFTGVAIWILLLDPLPKGDRSAWPGWRGRDLLLTLTAAYCLCGMAGTVWIPLLVAFR
jgi:hypothetical protein